MTVYIGYVLALWAVLGASTPVCLAASGGPKSPPVVSGLTQGNAVDQAAGSLIDPNYEKCGQDCIYLHGNENISFQLDYMERKMLYLKDPNKADEDKLRILGSFCKKGEALDDCQGDYEGVYKFWKIKVKASLAQQEKSINDLKCVRRDSSGRCLTPENGSAVPEMSRPDEPPLPKKSQAPYFLSPNELAQISKLNNVRDVRDSKDWMKDFFDSEKGLKPQKEDFIKFVCLEPAGSKDMQKCKRSAPEMVDGTFVLDSEAFQIAMNEWAGVKNSLTDRFAGRDLKKERELEKINFETRFSGPATSTNDPGRKLYRDVREQDIDEVNTYIQTKNGMGGVTREANYPGVTAKAPSKAPASDPVTSENKQVEAPMTTQSSADGRTSTQRTDFVDTWRSFQVQTFVDDKKSGKMLPSHSNAGTPAAPHDSSMAPPADTQKALDGFGMN